MRRCRLAIWLVGIGAWCVAYAVLSIVFWLLFALPFLVVLVLDALLGERPPGNVITFAPPAPPPQPLHMRFERRRAA